VINEMMLPASTLVLAQRSNADGAPAATGSPTGTATQGADGGGGGAPAKPPGGGLMALLPLFLVLMVVMMILSGRKQKKHRKTLMSSLSKQDKVQTIGGVIGTIVELRDHDVLLKVDEGSGTRIRFAKSAIQTVLKPARAHDIEEIPAEVKPEQLQQQPI